MKPDSHRRRADRRRSQNQTPQLARALPEAQKGKDQLRHKHDWRSTLTRNPEGYYDLANEDTQGVPTRIFMTEDLLNEMEDHIYQQIINATRFPGVKLVCLTPDAHYGYGVAVGSVILTDAEEGAIAMGPVGYDIGCFTGDTLVPTADGNSYRLDELVKTGGSHSIFALNSKHEIVTALATAKKTRISAPLLRLTLDNGRQIDCTPDHQFLLRSGEYEIASKLTIGSSLMPFHPKDVDRTFNLHSKRDLLPSYNHKVIAIDRLSERQDVFCLTVPEYGNFALDAGVFVHNCGMISARSNVPANKATYAKRIAFNAEVMKRIASGPGASSDLPPISDRDFQHIIREGASYYIKRFGDRLDHSRAERQMLPVDDAWAFPKGGKGRPERGIPQLGSLGGSNHFSELQRCMETGTLFFQLHTGSRGFGHGLATNYFDLAKAENPAITQLDLGYFTPESKHYRDYLNAVAAGANFAMVNRLRIFEQVAIAFRRVFGEDLELIYEISHNLVQREWHPDYGMVNVHRKGATRALPAGHPQLVGTPWEKEGHPILIPGSNMDYSYILRPRDSAKSGYSVNHGAGRKLSRSAAKNSFTQSDMDKKYKDMGIVVNTNGHVPLDEAGPAYKSSAEVIAAVTEANLAEVEYTLWPLASVKSI